LEREIDWSWNVSSSPSIWIVWNAATSAVAISIWTTDDSSTPSSGLCSRISGDLDWRIGVDRDWPIA